MLSHMLQFFWQAFWHQSWYVFIVSQVLSTCPARRSFHYINERILVTCINPEVCGCVKALKQRFRELTTCKWSSVSRWMKRSAEWNWRHLNGCFQRVQLRNGTKKWQALRSIYYGQSSLWDSRLCSEWDRASWLKVTIRTRIPAGTPTILNEGFHDFASVPPDKLQESNLWDHVCFLLRTWQYFKSLQTSKSWTYPPLVPCLISSS
jgi:hypothetical protein